MSWEKITFGELYKSPTRNGIYKEKSNHGSGVKIVNMGEIFAYDFIGSQDMQRIELTENELQNFRLEENDLLFARRSLVESGAGKASIVANLVEPTTFESSIIRVRLNAEICCPLFYLYWLRSLAGRAAISALVTGVNVKGIRGSELKDIKVDYPPIEIQRKISGILKEYDNLIENNQKQIKLLEEAAQRLYKEWFVDLRFPGYKNTPIIDGIPQGWRNGTLGEIAFFKRGKTITKDQTCEGFVPVVAGGLEPAYYHNRSNTASPVITVSGSGANAGFTRMYHTDIWASDCSFVDIQSTDSIYFAYCVLKNKKSDIDALQKGAAQPHVYAKDINALEILIPNSICLAEFEKLVTPFFEKIKVLYQQIKVSKESRDRLLPKLMSGELEV